MKIHGNECIVPNCSKEKFDSNTWFCGDHQREYKGIMDKARKGVLPVAVSLVGFAYKLKKK